MSLADSIEVLEAEISQLEHVVALHQRLLGEAVKSEPLPANWDKLHSALRSARDLAKRNQAGAVEPLLHQAETALESVRQWLAVGDLGISPFTLRTYLERSRPERDSLQILIRYHLGKNPHAESDRDKLDYLLASYFGLETTGGGEAATPEALARTVEELGAGLLRSDSLGDAAGIMLHEFESLIAMIGDFGDFDHLVQARMVERARALKTNLGEEFYHPRALATVIRFNVAFRRHFETLFHLQLRHVREDTRRLLDQAEEVAEEIEAAYQSLSQSARTRAQQAAPARVEAGSPQAARLGRPHEVLDERAPLDRLVRRGQEKQKEMELRGIITRITRFLEKLTPEQLAEETVTFRLRRGQLEVNRVEREAFAHATATMAPESARVIQYSLGVIAWMEEELAQYQETRDDRYLWKAHVDLLSYAVARSVDLLAGIRTLLREDVPAAESAWFGPLRDTARRLGTTLARVEPVFGESPAS